MDKNYEHKFGISEEGLGKFFKEGELLPWKHFMFKVVKVNFDSLVLQPVGYKKP